MRKMKKINGFLVVRFNDREKRDNPTLGSFGVIDGSQYTGDLDFDLDAFEYTDADLIEVLPGLMPKIIRRVAQLTGKPVIAGGLISDKEDVTAALSAGAVAVSTTNPAVWRM